MILVLTTSYGGECVGRNRKNITIQLNKRIDALLRIGEKKVKVGGRVATIRIISKSYIRELKKEENVSLKIVTVSTLFCNA